MCTCKLRVGARVRVRDRGGVRVRYGVGVRDLLRRCAADSQFDAMSLLRPFQVHLLSASSEY